MRNLGIEEIPIYFMDEDALNDDLNNIKKMLKHNPSINSVIISTPHTLHYNQVKYCLQQGLHVLVDKPLAITYNEAKELVELSTARDKILIVSNQRRYEDAYSYVKSIVQSGAIGSVKSINCILSHQQGWLHHWRTDASLSGGGAIFSVGHHLIDILAWILDDDLIETNVYGTYISDPKIESFIDALLLFRSGVSVTFTINHGAPQNAVYERLQIWSANGNITVDRFKPVYDREQPKVIHQMIDGTIIPTDFSKGISKKWAPTEDFVNSILLNEPSKISSGTLCLRTTMIIESMYRSLNNSARVYLQS